MASEHVAAKNTLEKFRPRRRPTSALGGFALKFALKTESLEEELLSQGSNLHMPRLCVVDLLTNNFVRHHAYYANGEGTFITVPEIGDRSLRNTHRKILLEYTRQVHRIAGRSSGNMTRNAFIWSGQKSPIITGFSQSRQEHQDYC
ncbi:hypothetical protein Bbelb_215280 [Branchiostoma belcheri]|nr:hypothetical protein Bbelb_215280 [Branchiostoma belcheri]